ncbi:Uncharacterized protein Fot_24832 [Forsythia ovata]|uniref:Uncharacterized protein n=1 Tax=Forsythia ovata TaxID=205694 RepID=A0ABD1U7A9_9LAMI
MEEEALAAGPSKKIVNNEEEEEALANEEAERPLKRLRLRYQEGQPSSHNTSNASLPVTPFIIPKEEKNVLLSHPVQWTHLGPMMVTVGMSCKHYHIKRDW